MKQEKFLESLDKEKLFESLHLIEQFLLKSESNLGTDHLPSQENIELKVAQQLGYEIGEFTKIKPKHNQSLIVMTNLIGLTGENGVLPKHYSELILQRLKADDPTLQDFLDIFNHRILSLFYRTWQNFQPTVQHRRVSQNTFSPWDQVLTSLTGNLGDRAIHWGGLFGKPVKSRGAIQACLESLSGCEVEIHDFKGKWMQLTDDEQTRLCSKKMPEGQFSELGRGASLGQKAWNVNAGFTVEFTAKGQDQVHGMMPKGERITEIKALCQDLLGETASIEWTLTAEYKHLPKVQLKKGGGRLALGSVLAPHKRSENNTITIRI
ncbi:conserved hypothetical protein [Vibrio nigripulchritudo SO65]|uniref:type VI secretion system baseplate subunit TssG n=1 Tax=Vibrio nigripulchritudo TaxID=28173 RepID=UPI0003B2302F|nr:type VI secretion system baseplate subunit TssG [Vibrio nigripulchritudo]CCN36822.1 conserved hypothetical protein [Vibrio nigripulchritudo AM115]CCN44598.1 conserved hypothetical protein [Vibrio nigripulchritudo FTn2]CCN66540.1 conserved hypothetical protein [Vibrio nigripulchritudo POn4]CCN72882.1 conserved hypothetical protein [Vibrio nigripulchritudo SFn118]CCN76194.1 conserved hypothetical protein [Vibrio nigripulchritudo SO65]